MTKLIAAALLAAIVMTPGCRVPEQCVPGQTRCAGAQVQICDSGGRYQTFLDCDQVTAQSEQDFMCCPLTEIVDGGEEVPAHTCLPVLECRGDHG